MYDIKAAKTKNFTGFCLKENIKKVLERKEYAGSSISGTYQPAEELSLPQHTVLRFDNEVRFIVL
ncbi:MAG TPA: hypothetical protein PKW80_04100 [Bacteroidales bacterium]|nr:hypothetical protein [Bacteroidales bacterium]